ncbi:MaoC family dehydratase [Breoghania sp. L-A4]|uniref:MaoC family dehydratase n=1 Tax=Breoghania sp. L-A4 TaxID=2304600 RepID=UPI000E358193|nr:MaoC family dehydratase [Breoghania sp. L-A4]AXS41457.1 MaoC family dehydratase [Breoghania sp. L-A4]
MDTFLTFEDFHPGNSIDLGTKTVTAAEIIAFASEFDPQPFHLDQEAGRDSILGGLAASGWHTAGILMRLLCDAFLVRSSSMGSPGITSLKWRKPVLAGDTLSARGDVLSARRSASRPDMGIVDFRFTVTNQNDEIVLVQENPILFGTRETVS